MSSASLNIYPSPLSENDDYLALLKIEGDIPAPEAAGLTQTHTIIVLDNSGSMGRYVERVCTNVFPSIFQQLGYDPEEMIDLVLFESRTAHHRHKVSEFPTLKHRACGGTNMTGVFPVLEKLFSDFAPRSNVRLITVSDGDVSSPQQTVELASKLNELVQQKFQLNIDSIAIRLFTSSYANPDTRALSSVLQFNTTANMPTLVDVDFATTSGGSDAPIIEKVFDAIVAGVCTAYISTPGQYASNMAKKPVAGNGVDGIDGDEKSRMTADEEDALPTAIFKAQPWVKTTVSLPVTAKTTLFWLPKAKFQSGQKFTISDVLDVDVTVHETITPEIYEELIQTRINYYMMQVKLLRVVGTTSSIERLKAMSNYFINLEDVIYREAVSMSENANDSASLSSLNARLAQLKKTYSKANSRLGLQMKEIANMDATTQFNAAQAASFLRSTTGSGSASRGLVRRAGTDLDFTSIVRGEVKAMAKELHKLEDKITPEMEENFNQSFVSLGSTMDGIRAVCSLATTTLQGADIELNKIDSTESILDSLEAFEILTYLNIVGVPVQATIGDYPDPWRYNISTAFPGHHCSLSDIMTLHHTAEANARIVVTSVTIPGYKGDDGRVDNVIPVFETPEIFHFLYKHAPSSLQLYCGIGMRRVLADIPGTLPAMLSTALIKLMRTCVVEPTEVNFTALISVYKSLTTCSTPNYNAPRFYELFNAVNHASSMRLGNVGGIKKALEEALVGHVGDGNNGDDEVVQLENIATASHVVTMHPSEYNDEATGVLPMIKTPLSQLILPLLQLYMFAENPQAQKSLTSWMARAVQYDDAAPKELSPENVSYALPSILRSLYINEAWTLLRTQYRGKPNMTQIISETVENLIAVDSNWTPNLTGQYDQDDEFNAENVLPKEYINKNEFVKSKSFKELQPKLNRFNVLLALPHFAKLLNATDADNKDEIKALESSLPKVLSTPETVTLLKKQKEFEQLTRRAEGGAVVNNNWYDDDDDFEWDEYVIAGPDADAQGQVDMIKEERKEQYAQVNNNIQKLWPKVFFGISNTEATPQHVAMMKFYATMVAFTRPQPTQRSPAHSLEAFDAIQYSKESNLTTISFINDIEFTPLNNNPFIQFLTKYRTQLYHRLYNMAVRAKVQSALTQVYIDYRQLLLDADTMEAFKSLLQNGHNINTFSASFKRGFQDSELAPLWKSITNKDQVVPLRVDKLRIIILGRDNDNNIVWNNGRILFDHKLDNAAVFFYDEDRRSEWITICNEYKERRKWDYRASDLPNRHSHHLSRPSYWGLGYDTLVDFKNAVDPSIYKQYCIDHKDCCGLTLPGHKRQKLGPKRHGDTQMKP